MKPSCMYCLHFAAFSEVSNEAMIQGSFTETFLRPSILVSIVEGTIFGNVTILSNISKEELVPEDHGHARIHGLFSLIASIISSFLFLPMHSNVPDHYIFSKTTRGSLQPAALAYVFASKITFPGPFPPTLLEYRMLYQRLCISHPLSLSLYLYLALSLSLL